MAKELPFSLPQHKIVVDSSGLTWGVYPHTTEGIRQASQQVRDLIKLGHEASAPMIDIGAPYTIRALESGIQMVRHGVEDGLHPGSNAAVVVKREDKLGLTGNWMD